FISFISFYSSGPHRDLHSFPTRRSSDLDTLARHGESRRARRALLLREMRCGSGFHKRQLQTGLRAQGLADRGIEPDRRRPEALQDRKSTRLNSSHDQISYAVFCLKKKKK